MGILFLTISVLFNVVANGYFKAASNVPTYTSRKILFYGLGLVIGFLNTLCYLKSLETIKLGTAYAIFAAASTILIALVSLLYFQEAIGVQKAIGLGVICLGLLLLWGT